MTIKEFILAAGALLALILIQMGATHGGALFHQAPWLDEVHTAILVNEPDPDKFHSAISDQCVDANFPVYYEVLRTLKIHSLPAIREISMAGTIAALLGIYVLLRGAFKPLESAVGVLAVWSTPEVVYHTFQARFYAPWFAAVIWFAVAMRWTKAAKIPWLAAIALGLTSLLACTLHVLGLPAIALVALAEFLADRGPLRSRIVRALPALAGAIAVMLFIPLMVQQKHSFQIKTWLTGNPLRLFYSTIGNLLPGVAASAIVLALFASAWCRKREDARPREIALRPLAGASSLIFFPIVLLGLTIISRPVLLPRYALCMTAAIAAAAGYAATRMRTCAAVVVCVVLMFESSAELSRRVREAGDNARELDARISAIHAEPDEAALFESRHQLFPVVWTAPDLKDRCWYIDFEPGPNQPDPVVEGFERDLARKFQHVFGSPRVMPWDRAVTLPRFILVPLDDDGDRVARRFNQYKVERVAPKRYELTRFSAAGPDDDESVFFKFK